MILTLKIKLLPDAHQSELLLSTIRTYNDACNTIASISWERKVFNQFKIHGECYYSIRDTFSLSAQLVVRAISKVANAYKLSKKVQPIFKPLGSITYDSRILNYKPNNIVSIYCLGGRQKISYICHNEKYIPYIKGEADLIYKKGKFYLLQCVDVPEDEIQDVEEFIGVDFGITDIAVTSDGVIHSSKDLNEYRERKLKIRSSLQSKGTKGAKKLLKRLSGRERTTATIINHTISKRIVISAKEQGKGICIENLNGIRESNKRRNKTFKEKLHKWSFFQLRAFLQYKSQIAGVPFIVIDPAYTSKTCSVCHTIGKRDNKKFSCKKCGNVMDADINASRNIATIGAFVNMPEKPNQYVCAI